MKRKAKNNQVKVKSMPFKSAHFMAQFLEKYQDQKIR